MSNPLEAGCFPSERTKEYLEDLRPRPELWQDAPHSPLEKLKSADAQGKLAVCTLDSCMEEGQVTAGQASYAYAAGDVLGYEVLEASEDRFEMNVTRCGYKETMERLGARDIGHLLICNLDFPMGLRAGPELSRTQTCMQGGSHCDFRYRKRS